MGMLSLSEVSCLLLHLNGLLCSNIGLEDKEMLTCFSVVVVEVVRWHGSRQSFSVFV